MRRITTLLALLLFVSFMQKVKAQSRYIVKFTNKAFQTTILAAPASYLSSKSIARRQKYNIPIDSTDLPVSPRYLDSLRNLPTIKILSVSKWLNQVAIQTTDATALAKIRSFPFVQIVNSIA